MFGHVCGGTDNGNVAGKVFHCWAPVAEGQDGAIYPAISP